MDLQTRKPSNGRKYLSLLQVDLSKVVTLCKLYECLLFEKGGPDMKADPAKLHSFICTIFVFCYIWSIGGNIIESNWDAFDTFVRGQFEENGDAKVGKCPASTWQGLLCHSRRYTSFLKTFWERPELKLNEVLHHASF